MSRIYLPRHEIERQKIIKRLRELRVYVPGANQLDVSHLQDILQKEEELAGKPKPPKPPRQFSDEEVRGALREFNAWRHRNRRLY